MQMFENWIVVIVAQMWIYKNNCALKISAFYGMQNIKLLKSLSVYCISLSTFSTSWTILLQDLVRILLN